MSSHNKLKRRTLLALKLGGTALLLYIVLSKVEWDDLGAILSGVEPGWLALTFACGVARIALLAKRWTLILGAQGISINFMDSFVAYIIAAFFNSATPANMGGDIYRMARVRHQKGLVLPGVSVLLEKLLGLAALLALLGIGIWIYWGMWLVDVVARIFALVCLAGLAGWLALAVGYKRSALLQKLRLKIFGESPSFGLLPLPAAALASTMALSIAAQIAVVGGYYFVFRALSLEDLVPAGYLLFAVPATSFCSMLPISISGIGVTENMFALFFDPFSVSLEASVALSWLGLAFNRLTLALIGGLLFAFRSRQAPIESPAQAGQD